MDQTKHAPATVLCPSKGRHSTDHSARESEDPTSAALFFQEI